MFFKSVFAVAVLSVLPGLSYAQCFGGANCSQSQAQVVHQPISSCSACPTQQDACPDPLAVYNLAPGEVLTHVNGVPVNCVQMQSRQPQQSCYSQQSRRLLPRSYRSQQSCCPQQSYQPQRLNSCGPAGCPVN